MREEFYEPTRAERIRHKAGQITDRIETIYLWIIRVFVLLLATGLILYAGYLLASGIARILPSPDSVVEEQANVTASELVDAQPENAAADAASGEPAIRPEWRSFYAGFVRRYYALFRSKFEPFRQSEDKSLSRDEFDDAFVHSDARMQALLNGEASFAQEREDLEGLLRTMTTAANDAKATQRLQRYKNARKVAVQRRVNRTRTEQRRGWNPYSTACSGWYYEPVGCPTTRTVTVPYTETVRAMEFPAGTQSHTQIFRAMQDRYFALLTQRRADNAANAAEERQKIAMGNVEGHGQINHAMQIFGGFIVLMFFFLLIAIERHQRRIGQALKQATEPSGEED